MVDYIYIIFIILLFIPSFFYWNKQNAIWYYFSILCTFILIAFRAPVVGADTYNYVRFFTGESVFYNINDSRELEPLFLFYNKVLNTFTYNGGVYIILNTFFTLVPVVYLIKKYSFNPSLSILLFFLFSIYTTYFVALRQVLAISLNLWSLIFILERRKNYQIWVVFFSICSYFIHTSSVITILIYTVAYFINMKKRIYFLSAIFLSALISFVSTKFSYLDIFSIISSFHIGSISRISSYINDYYTNDVNSFNVVLRVSAVGLFIYSVIKKEYLNHWLSKIYIISIVIYNIFNTFPMMSRINLPFYLMSILVFTWTVDQNDNQNFKRNLINIVSLVVVLYLGRSFIVQCINPDLDSSRLHPYYFFFQDYSNHPSILK